MEADRKIGWTFKRPYPASEPVLWRRLLGTSMGSSCCNKCVPALIRVATPSPNRPRPILYFLAGFEPEPVASFAIALMGLREGKPKTALWDPQSGDSTGDREADSSICDLSFLKLSLHPFAALLHHDTFTHWSLCPNSRTIVNITLPTFHSNLGRGTWLLSLTTRTIRVAWPLSGKTYMDVYSCGSRSLLPDSSHVVT